MLQGMYNAHISYHSQTALSFLIIHRFALIVPTACLVLPMRRSHIAGEAVLINT